MKQEIIYTYLGTNGTITSPVHLEGIYSVKKYRLYAEDKKLLTQNDKEFFKQITIPEDEKDLWKEVQDKNN